MFFVVNNVLAIACAWCIGRLANPGGDDPLKQGLAATVGYAVTVISVLQLLGAAQRLDNVSVTIAMVTVTAALFLFAFKVGAPLRSIAAPSNERDAEVRPDAYQEAARLIALVLFFGIFGAVAVRACFAGTEFKFDDLTYHASDVAQWLRNDGFSREAINAQAYYPKVAELMSLWFVLPFGSDGYASLAGLYWLLLLGLSVMHASRRLGVSWPAALLASTLCIGAFKTSEYAQSYSAVDLATYACLLAALSFAIPMPVPGRSSLTRRDALLSGSAAGLAMGAKLFALPGVALLFIWWCIAERAQGLRACVVRAICFASAVLLLGLFWYVRTFLLTGNPIFPANIGPLAGMPGFGQSSRLLDALRANPGDAMLYRGIASSFGNTGLAAVIVAALGFGASVAQLLRRRRTRTARLAPGFLLLLVVGSVYALMYPLLPFSGFPTSSGEYIVPARYVAAIVVPIGIVLFYCLFDLGRGPGATLLAFSVLAIVVSWRGTADDVGVAMLAGSAAILVLRRSNLRLHSGARALRSAVVVTVVAAFLAILAFLLPNKQRLTDDNLFGTGFAQPLAGTWRYIEENLPAGARITWHGSRAFLYYPLFGRDYRLEPVRTRSDGNLARPFFEESRQVQLASIDLDRTPVDRATFVHNLRSNGIDYVLLRSVGESDDVSTPELRGAWHSQLEALRSSEHAHLAYDDGETSLWRLDGGGA